ncbi:MAG: hypothetical protein ACYCZO_10110 [Daejeonella sp.]
MRLAYIRTRAIKKPKGLTPKEWMRLRYLKRLADNKSKMLEEFGISKEEYIAEVIKRLES